MTNAFNAMIPLLQGQQVEQGLSQAELEGLQLRERQALRKAAGKLGSQNYFAGYEGVPGAERPDYLKEAWAADPDAAAKMEAMVAEPFKLERAVGLAGRTEEAKKGADYRAIKNAFPAFFDEPASVLNAFAGTTEAPSAPAVGEPTSYTGMPPQPLSNLSGLSGTTKKMKIGPTGPEISAEQLSPFERGNQVEQRRLEREKFGLAGEAERRAAIQQAHENVQKVEQEMVTVQSAMMNHNIPWGEGQTKISQLKQEREALTARRDALAGGRASPQAAPMQEPAAMPAQAPSPVPTPSRGPGLTPAPAPVAPTPAPVAPAPMSAPAPSRPMFNEKDQAALDIANRQEKITAANKEIGNARLGVEKVTKFLPQIKELHRLVTSQNIGHPEMEAIPGAASALSLNRSNAQVKKLNEAIINMFAEPGQSQMMNTIVERQMQGAVVPGLFTEPQLNKINSSILMSNVEHLRNLPTFLEKWQKAHGGELTGAADAWIDYTDHNPRYGYNKDKRGTVTVHENKNVIAPETWRYLRENKMVRSVGEKTFIKQKDGSWVER